MYCGIAGRGSSTGTLKISYVTRIKDPPPRSSLSNAAYAPPTCSTIGTRIHFIGFGMLIVFASGRHRIFSGSKTIAPASALRKPRRLFKPAALLQIESAPLQLQLLCQMAIHILPVLLKQLRAPVRIV